ncbi:MAG: carboxylating nicotinate-nucleotide diphosphorylase [Deltaproteobacteria bacterium]|nr:carboxylating nicotinate-nucleotide diphosphorylase [Deltaproteobacteria bacterium]
MAEVRKIVERALVEDIGAGDITSISLITADQVLKGKFRAKAGGVIAGLELAEAVFSLLDPKITFKPCVEEGAWIDKGKIIAEVRGNGRGLLSGERVALNFLQRICGIATLTRRYVDEVMGTGAVILDTRKTVPTLRLLDKWGVRIGGGKNHRFGLDDFILIKENHIAAVGGLQEAVGRVKRGKESLPIEVEVTNLEELKDALAMGIDRILLDNMTTQQMRDAVQIAAGRAVLEASGNVTLKNVREIAKTGVNFVSVGNLTHSVQALDISFTVECI